MADIFPVDQQITPARRTVRTHRGLAALGARSIAIACVLAALPPVEAQRQDRTLFDRWAQIAEPLPGPPASIGFYSAGCLQGGATLPLDGDGYAVMRPSRQRFYGHPALIGYLTALAGKTRTENGRLLLFGDLGRAPGGPMLTGHASHQNGLDGDVWFTTLSRRPTDTEREALQAASFVVGRKTLKSTWTPAQAAVLAAAADSDDVNRIFVSPPIKRYMCRQYPTASWLYRLRPWWGHEDHFHVRLTCPADSPFCEEQGGLDPADNGCSDELAWWFSREADLEWKRLASSTEPRRFPELPPECAVPR
jgi:penicillin-insensitive murein endopeptidase